MTATAVPKSAHLAPDWTAEKQRTAAADRIKASSVQHMNA